MQKDGRRVADMHPTLRLGFIPLASLLRVDFWRGAGQPPHELPREILGAHGIACPAPLSAAASMRCALRPDAKTLSHTTAYTLNFKPWENASG